MQIKHPIIITCKNRRSIIDGERVILLRLRNKQKPTGIWPEQSVADPVKRMYVAHAWAIKAIIDDDFVNNK